LTLRIAVKYCGGCNPNYDRVALAEQLLERLFGIAELVTGDKVPDIVVAIEGCPTACADLGEYEGLEVLILTDPAQMQSVVDQIKKRHSLQGN